MQSQIDTVESSQKILSSELSPEDEFKARRLWLSACVPDRHKFFKPENNVCAGWTRVYEAIRERICLGFLFALIGPRGTGKTQMAVCLLRDACKYGNSSLYAKAMDIFIEIRSSYRGEGDSEKKVIDKYVSPKFLVIDALEVRGETDAEYRILSHIIDKRYDCTHDTLLISNQKDEDFAKSMGPSTISRIAQTGAKAVCDWDSFRGAVVNKI